MRRKTVLITGASGGLGRSIALAFAADMYHVALGYHRHEQQASELYDSIVAGGGSASMHCFDVTDHASTDAAVQAIDKEHGRLDVLVNNAGVASDGFAVSLTDEQWTRVLTVNLTGSFYCARAAARSMMRVRRGSIINVASTSGLRASPGQVNYSAAKGGIIAMTHTLAAELGRFGVRVNALVPGLIDSGMVLRMNRLALERQIEQIPVGRLGTADEIAGSALFLASDGARYMTGQSLIVDGGLSV